MQVNSKEVAKRIKPCENHSMDSKKMCSLREGLGMRRERLAADIGVSVPTIRNWEMGKTEPTLSQAVMLADLLGVDLAELTATLSVPE